MSPHRILLAEDDPDTCELLELVFKEDDVTCVFGYEHAMDRIRANGPFDLYVLDYYLPDDDGLHLCEAIRRSDQKTPIVFLTGSHSLQNADIRAAGAQYLVRKSEPNFLEQLKEHVKALLEPGNDVSSFWMDA
jgi:CheY-like chemotaxis protein